MTLEDAYIEAQYAVWASFWSILSWGVWAAVVVLGLLVIIAALRGEE